MQQLLHQFLKLKFTTFSHHFNYYEIKFIMNKLTSKQHKNLLKTILKTIHKISNKMRNKMRI